MRSALFATFFISMAVSATEMDTALQDGYSAGDSALNSGKNTAQGFNASKEFPGFNASPSETKYYGGGTQTSTNIGNVGNQELATSELGQLARESYINNPADVISYDSDLIKNSDSIRANADVIMAGTATTCVTQQISKVIFTNHACYQGKNITASCKKAANIEGGWVDGWKEEEFTINHSQFSYATNAVNFTFSFPSPATGEIVAAKLTLTTYGGYHLWSSKTNFLNSTFIMDYSQVFTLTPKNMNVASGQVLTGTGTPLDAGLNGIGGHIGRQFINGNASLSLKLTIKVKDKVWNPKIAWVETCAVDKENAVELSQVCSQPAETRYVTVDGKSYPVYSDCWEYTSQWQVAEQDDNTCLQWQNNKNCTVGTRTCLEYIGSYCVKENLTYQCQQTEKSEGYLCGGKFFCSDGKCASLQQNSNGDFGEAVSALAAVAAAGKDVALDPDNVTAFTGKAMSCRKAAAGFSNCCKNSGWGNNAGIAHCNSEEKAIGTAKEKLLTVDLGEYCSKKVLGVCLQKKRSYCVFESKLARIVQEQGRRDQLKINFGSAKSPNCRGITVSELQKLAFDIIDFSDFYSELDTNVSLPNQDALIKRIEQQIKNQMSGGN